jgi:phosphatidylglycerophosphate synthase
MRKIPGELENPIDNVLYELSNWMCPFFYKTGHTPNMITTYSLITGVLSCYFLWKGHILLFGIFYAISFFFDCMDGHFARKYNMTSKFGDMYDHIKDNIVALSILFVIYNKCRKAISIPIIILFLILTYLLAMHMGCQQKYCTKDDENPDDSKFLNTTRSLCPNKDMIKWTRFFGAGTYTLFSILIISYICYNRSENCKF